MTNYRHIAIESGGLSPHSKRLTAFWPKDDSYLDDELRYAELLLEVCDRFRQTGA
jgi:hypothetical protein